VSVVRLLNGTFTGFALVRCAGLACDEPETPGLQHKFGSDYRMAATLGLELDTSSTAQRLKPRVKIQPDCPTGYIS
jgi:hypothetical protein